MAHQTDNPAGVRSHELESGDALARALLDATQDLVFLMDFEGRYLDYHNPSQFELMLDPAVFLGQRAHDVLEGEVRDITVGLIETFVRTRRPQVGEYRTPSRGDGLRIFEQHLVPAGNDRILLIVRDMTDRHRAARSQRLLVEQQAALLRLERLDPDDQQRSVEMILEAAAKTLRCERVSIWLYNDDRTVLTLKRMYRLSDPTAPTDPVTLSVHEYPSYFRALEEEYTIACSDAATDPHTSEFAEAYLKPLGISSMLDVPIRRAGTTIGVVCCEHVGPMRTWALEEQDFAASISDLVTMSIEYADRARLEMIRSGEARALERLSRGESLESVLDATASSVEEVTGLRAAIHLIDPTESVLRFGAAPSLAECYRELIDGFPLNPQCGCCGKAVKDNELVIVRDTLTDPLWEGLQEFAEQFDIKACWSQPIRTPEGQVIGTLAVFAREARDPSTEEREMLERASQIAGLALARRHAEEDLHESRERFDLALKGTNLGVWDWDVRNNRVVVDERWAAMLGYSVSDIDHRVETRDALIHPDDVVAVRRMISEHLAGRLETYEAEYRMRTKDGSYRWVLDRGAVVERDSQGHALRATGTHLDIHARRVSEERLRMLSERLASHMEHSPLSVIEWDGDLSIRTWSGEAERTFGWTAEEAIGRSILDRPTAHEDDRFIVNHGIRDLRAGREQSTQFASRHLTKDGAVVHCVWHTSSVDTGDGQPASYLSLVQNVTDQAEANERQTLMVRELNHRVKNNLAAVLSLADQTCANVADLDEFRPAFVGRINALVRTHSLLAQTHWAGMQLGEVARLTLSAYSDLTNSRVRIEGPECLLPAHAATPVCMALHELATNAAKYGALSSSTGVINLCWTVDGPTDAPTSLTLTWREDGGPPTEPPTRRGLGTSLITDAIRFQLKGDVETDYRPEGLYCRISIDLRTRDHAG